MLISSISPRKRGILTSLALISGVTIASALSAFIETPQIQNEFLHEHLAAVNMPMEPNWISSDIDLSKQDKVTLLNIILQSERQVSPQDLKEVLTGPALEAVKSNICRDDSEICKFPLRLNRQFSTVHMNADRRVVNVEEKSLRVDLEIKLETTNSIELKALTDETRVLSFYQTQTGWIQNRFASVKTKPLSLTPREGLFQDRFADGFSGINYYPASASWADFWTVFPRREIEADLERAKSLNINALRIFLNHAYFDGEDTQDDALAKLQIFLDMCEAKGLSVIVTLFDLRPDYTLSNWDADITHIDGVLSRIAPHKAVLAIDLKNQPDLDFDNWGQGRVEAWLTVMARHIQTRYSQFPVTAGWSKPQNASRLIDIVDLVTYHEYESPKGLEGRLNMVRELAGDKPVMITELGSTIWHPPFIKTIQEAKQAARLDDQLQQLHQANGVFVWTLNDFDHVSTDIVGPLPWRRAQQKHFGLIRSDGTLRPAANILKSFGERSEPLAEKSNSNSNSN